MKNTTHKIIFTLFLVLSSLQIQSQVKIIMENVQPVTGEEFCVDVIVENFTDIFSAQFTLSWDPSIIQFESTSNLHPDLAGGTLFGTTKTDEGILSFQWLDGAQALTLDNGQIMFSLCFTAIGQPEEETKVRIGNVEGGVDIEFIDINDQEVTFSGASDAEITILYNEIPDDAIIVYYDDIAISEMQEFCVPIRVRNFNRVSSIQFSMQLDRNRYRFIEDQNVENWGGFASAEIGDVSTTSTIRITYLAIDFSFQTLSLDDGDVLFELCFEHLLAEGCVNDEILFSANPLDIEASIRAEGEDEEEEVSVYDQFGKIRLLDGRQITLDSEDITPVTCTNPTSGAISITASGGTENLSYNWSNGGTGTSITGLENGIYEVSISDACLAVDTLVRAFEVEESDGVPVADAGEPMNLDCSVTMVTLDGTGSSAGAQFQYDWGPVDGQTITSANNTNELIVDQPGRYALTVFNTATGCSDIDTVMVTSMRSDLEAMAGEDIDFGCDDETLRLEGSGTSGVNITYTWSSEDGNIIDIPSKGGAVIDRPGTYIFQVIDEADVSCFTSDTVVVGGDNYKPVVDAIPTVEITCMNPEVMLSAINNGSAETDIDYDWMSTDGSFVGANNGFSVGVNAAGTYIVTASTTAGCTTIGSVSVVDQRTSPAAVAGNDVAIECEDDYVTLVGSGDTGAGYAFSWSTDDGNIIEVISGEEVRVSSAGTYTFTVEETATGCTGTSSLEVTGNNEKPQASISGNDAITCDATEISLNANNGGAAVAGYSYVWMTTNGSFAAGSTSNTVDARIDAPGTYRVLVTNTATSCSTPATLTVTDGREDPVIAAGSDESIECEGGTGPLTVTTDDMGNMNFSWSLIEGTGAISSGANSSTAEYSGPGKYVVTVTNPLNGCSSTDTTEISLMNNLPLAMVGSDYEHCSSETILMANSTDQVTGAWTVIAGNAVLEDPTDRNCRVNSLSEGVNSFVWTLSTTQCPEYSSDTINITLIAEPMVVDDAVNLTQGFGSTSIDILSNDSYAPDAMVSLLSQPSLGEVTETSPGVYTYTLANENAFGNFTFTYEICDEICPMLCDDGTVTIDVRDSSLPPVTPENPTNDAVSLGITPNGDGLNDLLIFDELIDYPDTYPTKRLLIYNRWGDIVHESMPYQNDWGGTDKRGGMLAQGTYYFVLQLDLGNGLVVEGDITILQ